MVGPDSYIGELTPTIVEQSLAKVVTGKSMSHRK